MNDIIVEIVQIVVMIATLIVCRYVIPWLKGVIETNNLGVVTTWVTNAVLMAQQVLTSSSGEEKKQTVTKFIKNLLNTKNISITDEQLDTLIEAAVKEMKIAESEVANANVKAK